MRTRICKTGTERVIKTHGTPKRALKAAGRKRADKRVEAELCRVQRQL